MTIYKIHCEELKESLSLERLETFKETIDILIDETEFCRDQCGSEELLASFRRLERNHYIAQLKSLREVETVANEWIRLKN